MDTELVKIDLSEKSDFSAEDLEALKRAGEIIKNGGLVAFPTETVYGLGGDALNPSSSEKIYAAKGRPSDNPLIVHIADWEDIHRIAVNIPTEARKLADAFWPGPLTMVLNKSEAVPLKTTGGLNTVAVRFPSDRIARSFIKEAGGYVAAPSANISGRPSPTKAMYVCQDMDGRIEMIIDGGENEIGLESTIVDMTVFPPQVLRPGYITNEMIGEVLGVEIETDRAIIDTGSGLAPKAPGMKYRHYAPKGDLAIVEGKPEMVAAEIGRLILADKKMGLKTGVMCSLETAKDYDADVVKPYGKLGDGDAMGHSLYSILRAFDDCEVDKIYSESFEASGFGVAIMNRLLKAAGHRIIKV